MLSSSLIRPDGTILPSWSSPPTSPCCRCRRDAPSSTRSRMSGSSRATTGCRTASSNPTTKSSTTAASPGTTSSISRGASCASACASGHMGHGRCALVLRQPCSATAIASGASGLRLARQPAVRFFAIWANAVILGYKRKRRPERGPTVMASSSSAAVQ